jgi:hypothetical protein
VLRPRCERQIGYTTRHSAVFGTLPIPVICSRSAEPGSHFCADHAQPVPVVFLGATIVSTPKQTPEMP